MTERLSRSLEQGRQTSRAGAADSETEWAEPMARVGGGARGIAYGAAGVLAASAAVAGVSAEAPNAAVAVLSHDFGQFLFIIVSVALFAYSGWCMIYAVADPELDADQTPGLKRRLSSFSSGLVHGAFGVYAALLSDGVGANQASELAVSFWASVMSGAIGPLLMGAVAVALICYGGLSVYKSRDERGAPAR